MFNPDLMANAKSRRIATCTMGVIDAVQDMAPHEQTASLAAAFLLLTERHDVEPQDAFTVTKNIMNHAEGRRPEFMAVRQYLENEL